MTIISRTTRDSTTNCQDTKHGHDWERDNLNCSYNPAVGYIFTHTTRVHPLGPRDNLSHICCIRQAHAYAVKYLVSAVTLPYWTPLGSSPPHYNLLHLIIFHHTAMPQLVDAHNLRYSYHLSHARTCGKYGKCRTQANIGTTLNQLKWGYDIRDSFLICSHHSLKSRNQHTYYINLTIIVEFVIHVL